MLVLGEYSVYDGFPGIEESSTCPKAGSFPDATSLRPSGGREFGFRYHGIDIYRSDGSGNDIL